MHDQLTILSHPAKVHLFDMLPRVPMNDVVDYGEGHAKEVSKLHLRMIAKFKQAADFVYLFLIHLCSSTAFTLWWSRSAFGKHIVRIVRICSQKYVIWIDAQAYIALVASNKAIGNRANCGFIGKAMGSNLACSVVELSVPTKECRCYPQPTLRIENGVDRAILVDFFPKAGLSRSASTMPRDKAHMLSGDDAFFDIARFGNVRNLSATAFAQSRRIWWGHEGFKSALMPKQVKVWLAFYITAFRVVFGRELGLLPTTTMAVTIRDFVRGIMEAHRNLSFLMPNPGTCSTTLPGVSIGLYSFNYTTLGRIEEELCTTI